MARRRKARRIGVKDMTDYDEFAWPMAKGVSESVASGESFMLACFCLCCSYFGAFVSLILESILLRLQRLCQRSTI